MLNTKEDILKNDWNQTVVWHHSRNKKYYGSQWCLPIIPQNIFFCVQQKKETHTGLQQLECE